MARRGIAGVGGAKAVGDLLGRFVRAVHGEAVLYVVASAADGDGQLEALAVLLEERIERGEEDGLPAGDHLRGGGVGADVAEELEGAAVNQVGSMELRGAAGNLVVERGDEQLRVAEREVNGHLGGDFGLEVAARGLGVVRVALGAHAHGIDAVLQLGVGELDALNVDRAGELKLLHDANVAGRNVEPGVESDVAAHDGWLGLHRELEEIFDAAARHVDGEADVVALAVDVGHGAPRGEVGVKQRGVHGIERGVAIGAVDEGVEGGLEGDGVVGDVEREIGGGGGAVDGDVIESAGELASGGEGSADAFDGVEVGVGKGVLAVDGGGAGIVAVPGAEVAGSVDGADGLGIDEEGVVEHGRAGANVGELEVLDGEAERVLGRVGVLDDEVDVLAVDLRDGDLDARVGRGEVRRVGAAVRRNVEVHAIDVDARDVRLEMQERVERGVEDEVVHAEHGRRGEALLLLEVGLGGAGEIEDTQAAAFDLEAGGDGDVEGVELDGRVEAVAEGGDDAAAEDGADVVGDVLGW